MDDFFDEKNEDDIIDEIIRSLDIDMNELKETCKDDDILYEYEIVMNCDDSDYIIYYKK